MAPGTTAWGHLYGLSKPYLISNSFDTATGSIGILQHGLLINLLGLQGGIHTLPCGSLSYLIIKNSIGKNTIYVISFGSISYR